MAKIPKQKKPKVIGRRKWGEQRYIDKKGKRHHNDRTYTETFFDNGKSRVVWEENKVVSQLPEQKRRGARYGIGVAGNVAGGLLGAFTTLAGALFAIYIFILLARAYNHLPFIGIYDTLKLLGNGSINPFAQNVSIAWSRIDTFIGSAKWSFQNLLPDNWQGLATVLDYTVNAPYITITVLQVIMGVLRLFFQLLSIVYGFGNFVSQLATSGNGFFAGEGAFITLLRDNLWNDLAGIS